MEQTVPFDVASNSRQRSCISISAGMYLEIRIKKRGISNPAGFCICDDPCFSKF